MTSDISRYVSTNYKRNRVRKIWKRILWTIAAAAVFCTTYVMILPAITWERTLICERPEHRHDESCYETVVVPGENLLMCEKEEHVHDDGCFNEAGELICLLEEHTHGDECYGVTEEHTETVLVCQLEEHEHTEACFDAPPAEEKEYFCGKIEHMHSEEQYCYFNDGSLRCTIPEHQHTLACKSNPEADAETAEEWEAVFADVELIGCWGDDVIAIAETQAGYTESVLNYEVQEDGEAIKGYTRYGDWYGDPYGDWDAMFCSFCLNYAGVEGFPAESDSAEWIRKLSYDETVPERPEYYREAGTYEPEPGDLIFFDWDPYLKAEGTEADNEQVLSEALPAEYERKADHVGFVKKIIFDEETDEPVQIITIEGDSENKVSENIREWNDDRILGYGEIPENPDLADSAETEEVIAEERTIESEPASDGAVAVITGMIPEEAAAEINAVTLSEEQLAEYFGKEKASMMQSFAAYDIRIMVDGEEWQPDESVNVKVVHPDIDVPADGLAVAHIKSSDNSAVSLLSQVDEDGNISFDTDGFSVYVLYLFTVDYYYGGAEYHQNGMTTMYLSELFEALAIEKPVSGVSSVEFTRPDLLQITFDGTDWTLTSLQPFSSAEFLTIYFADGSTLVLNVFDAASVKVTFTDNYNLITTLTDAETLLEAFDVRNQLSSYGVNKNTAIKSITVTPSTAGEFEAAAKDGKQQYIRCTKEFTAARSCTVVFDVQDGDGNDIACEFTNITANNGGRYDLWNYNGEDGTKNIKAVAGSFENLIKPIDGTKEWMYPTDAADNSNIHTDNAPIGFSKAVFTTKGKEASSAQYRIEPIVINGKNYFLYVSSQLSTAYNGSGYRQGSTTGTNKIAMGRFSKQNCSLPCVKGGILLVCWIENAAGEKVILPNVCVGNEGASNLWNWKFGGSGDKQGNKIIYTNDSSLKWNKNANGGNVTSDAGRGTSVSSTNVHLFQGILPDENGYYTIQLATQYTYRDNYYSTPENVDELSIFQFTASTSVRKTVLDADGNTVTGQDEQFDFGARFTPQVSTVSGEITENFRLANKEFYNISGAINTDYRVWEVIDPHYTTTIKIDGSAVDAVTETITPESGEPYQIIRPKEDYKITAGSTTIEFINRKLPLVSLTITKEVAGIATDRKFGFLATAADGSFGEGEGYTITDDGVRFELAANETVTLNVSPGATVTVTETDFNGFHVKFSGANGYNKDGASDSFLMEADRRITVTNTAGHQLPETGGHGVCPIYLFGLLLIAGAVLYGYGLTRGRKKS